MPHRMRHHQLEPLCLSLSRARRRLTQSRHGLPQAGMDVVPVAPIAVVEDDFGVQQVRQGLQLVSAGHDRGVVACDLTQQWPLVAHGQLHFSGARLLHVLQDGIARCERQRSSANWASCNTSTSKRKMRLTQIAPAQQGQFVCRLFGQHITPRKPPFVEHAAHDCKPVPRGVRRCLFGLLHTHRGK